MIGAIMSVFFWKNIYLNELCVCLDMAYKIIHDILTIYFKLLY